MSCRLLISEITCPKSGALPIMGFKNNEMNVIVMYIMGDNIVI